ncbi:MAG: polyisoprenoid-binding protein [Myxococcaceae bacterium]|nr:polyisoprenoid-binding protein [Myxococcaceae bacterium]
MNLIKNAVAALAVVLFPSFAVAAPWVVDSAHAQAKFTVKHMMVMDVVGTLGKVSGGIELDEKDPTKSVIDVTVDVEPNTQEAKRDGHLKGPDFFDVEKFPKATFKSKKIAKAGKDKFKVTGDLTLRDVTKETTFDLTLTAPFEHPFTKAPVRAVTATTKINRLDFGLKWQAPMANNALLVGNDVKIELAAEITPKPAEGAEAAKEEPKKEEAKPAPAKK